MPRGRKPKPIALKVLEGNPGRRPLNHREPKSNTPCPCPDWLDEDAKAERGRVLAVVPPQLLTGMDVPTLAAHCQAWSMHKRAVEEFARGGRQLLVPGARGARIANPLLRVIRTQTDIMLKTASRLGFDPSARAGMRMPDPPEKDSFAGLIGGVSNRSGSGQPN